MDQLHQELDSFGARFQTNRLVDLAINQSANARTIDKIHDMVSGTFFLQKLEKWLRKPPDVTQKHHDTEKLFKAGTGRWLLDGDKFIEWQDNAGFLWIEGPCAGKSVLSATVIGTLFAGQELFTTVENSPPPPAVTFFYYNFRNKETQTVEIALRRIALRLSAQSPHPYRVLDEHYNLSNGQTLPTFRELHRNLEKLQREIGRTYIVLNVLDECKVGEFDQLVDLVSTLRAWAETPLHLLFTSQPRPVFTEGFEGIPCNALGFDVTEEDIRFCLAACLLLKLARCKRADKLAEVLENLPNDLFEANFTLTELTDAIAFDFSNTEQYIYKPDYRKANATTIFDWLERLVIEIKESNETRVELAHASVQDYLLSNQFRAKFSCNLSELEGHSRTFIVQTCISHLLYFGDDPLEEETIPNYPLAVYAGNKWYRHLLQCHDRFILFGAAMRILEDGSQQYKALCYLRWDGRKSPAGSPLYLCCQIGDMARARLPHYHLPYKSIESVMIKYFFFFILKSFLKAHHTSKYHPRVSGFKNGPGITQVESPLGSPRMRLLLHMESWGHSYGFGATRGERKHHAVGPAASVKGVPRGSPPPKKTPRSGPPQRAEAPRSGPSGKRQGGLPRVKYGPKSINWPKVVHTIAFFGGDSGGGQGGLGDIKAVEGLLANNADIHRGFEDCTSLMVASLRGHKYCGECGSALSAASAGGHIEIVHLLLANSANIATQGSPLLQEAGAVLTSEERTLE
ncbi:hypothetical protein DFH07DRAFT_988135 [Mycena maculata]|uniref:Nephrocystin 3-like N-terminal domain-containing protein n=1 Tax=Mycena maculata TaxID=230809 RepID=A0AAD7JXX4_9AGAR|nr:hypothetical protein DFH07DRAFT_988135 [Mycena maculata]